MNNHLLTRWIALLLVPCLIVDPATAAAFNNPLASRGMRGLAHRLVHRSDSEGGSLGEGGVRGDVFAQQALTQRLAEFRGWMSRFPKLEAFKELRHYRPEIGWEIRVGEDGAVVVKGFHLIFAKRTKPPAAAPEGLPGHSLPDFSPRALSALDWEPFKAAVEKVSVTHLMGRKLDRPIVIARKTLIRPDDRDSFNRHLIAYLLDEYFRKRGYYATPHIPPPIGHDAHGIYCYRFTEGSDRTWAWNFPSFLLRESKRAWAAFGQVGVPLETDVFLTEPGETSRSRTPSPAAAGSQTAGRVVARRPFGLRIHNIVIESSGRSVVPTRHWWRVDYAHNSFRLKDPRPFENFISNPEEGQRLLQHLGSWKTRLLELAFYHLPEATERALVNLEQPGEYDELVGAYQRELADRLIGRPHEPPPETPPR